MNRWERAPHLSMAEQAALDWYEWRDAILAWSAASGAPAGGIEASATWPRVYDATISHYLRLSECGDGRELIGSAQWAALSERISAVLREKGHLETVLRRRIKPERDAARQLVMESAADVACQLAVTAGEVARTFGGRLLMAATGGCQIDGNAACLRDVREGVDAMRHKALRVAVPVEWV